jgi:hypothetical protein
MTPWWATIIGTALGGLIAAAAGWLNAWGQARREARKEGRSWRRVLYAEYLHHSQVALNGLQQVTRELNDSARPGKGEPSVDSTRLIEMKARLSSNFDQLMRSYDALALSAPALIRDVANTETIYFGSWTNKSIDAIQDALHGNHRDWPHTYAELWRLYVEARTGTDLIELMNDDVK